MADPALVESVEFRAEGIDDIIAETEDLRKAVQKAYAQQLAMKVLLADPVYREAARQTAELAKANRDALAPAVKQVSAEERTLAAAVRERAALQDRQQLVRSAAVRGELRDIAGLRREVERLEAAERSRAGLLARSGDLRSGAYLRDRRAAVAGELRQDAFAVRERRAALASGDYLREGGRRLVVTQAENRQAADERGAKLGSGLYLKERAAAAEQQATMARLAAAERAAALRSGQYAAEAGRRESQRRQDETLARSEHRADLRARYGRVGGDLVNAHERARPAMLMAAGMAAGPLAMARSGFSGTVEGNRFSAELTLLNREIAGALVPVMKDLTQVIKWVRSKLEGMSRNQQHLLGYGLAGAGALGAIGAAAPLVRGAAGLIGGAAGLVGLGGAASPAAAAGGIGGGAASGAAGGLAAGRMATLSPWVAMALLAANHGRGLARAADTAQLVASDDMKSTGDKVRSTVSSYGDAVTFGQGRGVASWLYRQVDSDYRRRQDRKAAFEKKDREGVTLDNAGFMDGEDYYKSLAVEGSRLDNSVPRYERGASTEDLLKQLVELNQQLLAEQKKRAGDLPPVPRR